MPLVYFMVWINENSKADPGHLVMVWAENGICLEYARGGDENYSESIGMTLKSKSKPEEKGKPTEALKVIQNKVAENILAQKAKSWGKSPVRFTHVLITEPIEISKSELDYLRKMAALRTAAGAFQFFREAEVFDPLLTRCLSSLRDLAGQRDQNKQLGVGYAEELLVKFAKLNNVACTRVSVDKFNVQKVLRLRGG
jgi:hypothetical protein